MRLDPNIIRQQIANLLVAYPDLQDDEALRANMIEGETEAFDFLSRVVRQIGESKALASGTDEYVKELRERSSRIDRRIEALRSLAFKIMDAANLRKAELPEATLSVKNGAAKVIITDETSIPDILCKITRSPDKTKIKDKLEAGETIAGAALSNSEPTLSIRTR